MFKFVAKLNFLIISESTKPEKQESFPFFPLSPVALSHLKIQWDNFPTAL